MEKDVNHLKALIEAATARGASDDEIQEIIDDNVPVVESSDPITSIQMAKLHGASDEEIKSMIAALSPEDQQRYQDIKGRAKARKEKRRAEADELDGLLNDMDRE